VLDTGGVGRIKKMMPKAAKVGTDGVVSPRNVFEMTTRLRLLT